jgi:predicted nucleic-acid-binding protein
VIALDTNVLARFYCEDPSDPEAVRQRPAARRVLLDGGPLFVPLTVVLELEWVMRGFYALPREAFCAAADHLLGMPHVTVDRWQTVKDAIELHRAGYDFADALHLAASSQCERFLTFDDRGLARRARRDGLLPTVEIAK